MIKWNDEPTNQKNKDIYWIIIYLTNKLIFAR